MKKWLPFIGSALVISILLLIFDWNGLRSYKDRLNWISMLIGIFFYLLSLFLRSLRFRSILPLFWYCRISWIKGLEYTNIGTFTNHVLPFRMGEVVFVFLGRKWWRIPTPVSIVALLTVRIYDAIAMVIIFVFTVLLVSPKFSSIWYIAATVLIVSLLATTIYLDKALFLFINLIKQCMKLFPSGKIIKEIKSITLLEKTWKEAIKFRSCRNITLMLTLSFCVWFSLIVFYQKMLGALGIELDYKTVILGSFGASLASFLPINLMGSIGTLEAGWTLGFIAIGLSPSDATASGLMMHLVAILVVGTAASISIFRSGALFHKIRKRESETYE